MKTRLGWFAAIQLACLITAIAMGCAPATTTSPAASKKTTTVRKPAAKKPASRPKPKAPASVAANAFPDIDAAVSTLSDAAENSNSERRLTASAWLAMQGADAVPALSTLLADQNAGTASRISACRALGRIGTPATETLLGYLKDENSLVRINALNQLPHIKPPTRAVLDALIETLDHEDPRMRQQAIRGLAQMGPTAKDAAPHLQEILNSRDDETLRNEAKKALKKVQPRRTLTFE